MLLITTAVIISWSVLVAVYGIAAHGDQQSHILLILPVSLVLLYSDHSEIFRKAKYCLPAGAGFILFGLAAGWLRGHPLPLGKGDALSLQMTLFIGSCIAAFVLCYGAAASRVAVFPLLSLFLMVPIPGFLLERTIELLQRGSTDAAFFLLKAVNIPVAREGFILSLPKLDIEVARECSGIRSSLMLLVVTLVLGHLFLQSNWKKCALVSLVVPIAVVKNGFRIFALAALGTNIDPSLLHGYLHRYAGIPSFGLALGAVMLIVRWLHSLEKELPTTGKLHANAVQNPKLMKGGA